MIMCCNQKPEFDVEDKALISRLRFIPFEACFQVNKENCDKVDNIKLLKDAFFTWMVQGSIEYYQNGDIRPMTSKQKQILEETISENDYVGNYIEDYYNVNPQGKAHYNEFMEDYNSKHKFNRLKTKELKFKLSKKGFSVYKSGTNYIKGLERKPDCQVKSTGESSSNGHSSGRPPRLLGN